MCTMDKFDLIELGRKILKRVKGGWKPHTMGTLYLDVDDLGYLGWCFGKYTTGRGETDISYAYSLLIFFIYIYC